MYPCPYVLIKQQTSDILYVLWFDLLTIDFHLPVGLSKCFRWLHAWALLSISWGLSMMRSVDFCQQQKPGYSSLRKHLRLDNRKKYVGANGNQIHETGIEFWIILLLEKMFLYDRLVHASVTLLWFLKCMEEVYNMWVCLCESIWITQRVHIAKTWNNVYVRLMDTFSSTSTSVWWDV